MKMMSFAEYQEMKPYLKKVREFYLSELEDFKYWEINRTGAYFRKLKYRYIAYDMHGELQGMFNTIDDILEKLG